MQNDANSVEWNGVPENPEKDGWHWLQDRQGNTIAAHWNRPKHYTLDLWMWSAPGGEFTRGGAASFHYLGPCLTPSEVTARETSAWTTGVENAASLLDDFQHELQENIKEDECQIEGGKEIKPLPHALRWLKYAAANIRALPTPPMPNQTKDKTRKPMGQIMAECDCDTPILCTDEGCCVGAR